MHRTTWALKFLAILAMAALGASALLKNTAPVVSVAAGAALLLIALVLMTSIVVRELQTRKNRSSAANETSTLDLLDKEFDAHSHALFSAMSDLSATDLSKPQKRQLMSLRRGLENLATLQHDTVQFVRLLSPNSPLASDSVVLEDLTWEVVNPILKKFRSNETEIVCHFSHLIPETVTCDRGLLYTLLQHLVASATAVTVKGEVVIQIAIGHENPRHPTLVISVSDSGPGIPSEQLSSAFDPFRLPQGQNGRRMATSGLALALARRAAQLLDGTLRLTSIEGKGSTIVFRMPIPKTALSAKHEAKHEAKKAHVEAAKSKHALVIDDSRANLKWMRELLERRNFSVLTFESPREALAFLRSAERNETPWFDFLFLDNSIDDFDYAAIVRFVSSHRDTFKRTVLMVSDAESVLRPGKILEPGIDTWLAKPIRKGDFECILNNEPIAARTAALKGATAARGTPFDFGFATLPPNNGTSLHPVGEEDLDEVVAPPQPVCLVVDDNLVNMHTVSALLRTKNIDVLVAENGKEALEVFIQAPRVDFVLMDLQMPEMDGFEAARRIRQLETDREMRTPIIALTAFSTRSEHEKCLSAGMDGFLSKPIQPSDLFDLLHSYSLVRNSSEAPHSTSGISAN